MGVKVFRPTIQNPEDYERSSLLDLAKAVCDHGDQYTPDDIDDLVGKYLQPTAEPKASKATGRFSGMLRTWQEQENREKEQIRGQLLGQLLAHGVSRKRLAPSALVDTEALASGLPASAHSSMRWGRGQGPTLTTVAVPFSIDSAPESAPGARQEALLWPVSSTAMKKSALLLLGP